jgi:5-methylcytosine-specific restriction endonuclease McrA
LRERDAGVCAICGINADIVIAEYRQKRAAFYKKQTNSMVWRKDEHGIERYHYDYRAREDIEKLDAEYKEQGWPVGSYSYRWWHVDHELPVAEGGGPDEWPRDRDYLDNLRTLCIPCHKKETRALRARLKEKRNGQKQLQKKGPRSGGIPD